jgi:hypothetical protein
MTPDELRQAGQQLFPGWGWQTRLAEALKVDGSTVRRWLSGSVPIPGPAQAAIQCFLDRKNSETRE